MSTLAGNEKRIAVIGATGQQGGAVLRALQAGRQFTVRALTRHPSKHRDLADEVVEADLDRPETLKAAFEGAHGVFLVTNFWEQGTDEIKQATTAVRAAKDAGVKHFVWSTLPDVEAISGGEFDAAHFTGKAKVDPVVREVLGFLTAAGSATAAQRVRTGRPSSRALPTRLVGRRHLGGRRLFLPDGPDGTQEVRPWLQPRAERAVSHLTILRRAPQSTRHGGANLRCVRADPRTALPLTAGTFLRLPSSPTTCTTGC